MQIYKSSQRSNRITSERKIKIKFPDHVYKGHSEMSARILLKLRSNPSLIGIKNWLFGKSLRHFPSRATRSTAVQKDVVTQRTGFCWQQQRHKPKQENTCLHCTISPFHSIIMFGKATGPSQLLWLHAFLLLIARQCRTTHHIQHPHRMGHQQQSIQAV